MLSRLPYILGLFVCFRDLFNFFLGGMGIFYYTLFRDLERWKRYTSALIGHCWTVRDVCLVCLTSLTRVSFTVLFFFPFYSCIWVGDTGDSFFFPLSVATAQRLLKLKKSMDWMWLEFLTGSLAHRETIDHFAVSHVDSFGC